MKVLKFISLVILTICFSKLPAMARMDLALFTNQDSIFAKASGIKDSIKNRHLNEDKKNLIVNGNFEEGNKHFYSGMEFSSESVTPGNYTITNNAFKHNSSFFSVKDHTTGSGNYMMIDASPEENIKIWCSKVKVDPQAEYQFSLYACNLNIELRYPATIRLLINGEYSGEPIILSDNSKEWTEYTWKWYSGQNKDTVHFCLEDTETSSNGNDFGIDDINLYKIKQDIIIPKEVCPDAGDTLAPAVHFPFNESTITEFSKEKLNRLLDVLRKCPKMKITITGHTDKFGTDTYNYKLSEERAKAIFNYLELNGIKSERMAVIGMGESKIIYHGPSIKDNVRNRRVLFIVSGFLN